MIFIIFFYHHFLCTLDVLLVHKGLDSMNILECLMGCVIMYIVIGSHFYAIQTN